MPSGTSISRFSTSPSSVTRTTSARPGAKGTNSICFSGRSVFGAMTMLAQRDRPESAEVASTSACDRLFPAAAHIASMLWRSASPRPPSSKSPLTKRRNPASVGSLPAEVCGANSRPASSRSAMTLRIEAGERSSRPRRARVREPTGSPVST